MEYRIIIETEASGKEWFYVQRRNKLPFWKYARQILDMSMYAYRIKWERLEDAKDYINSDIAARIKKKQERIIERRVCT